MNSFTRAVMYRLLVITSLIILSNCGVVRVPKIYNALISSDENLSPSHAIPVIEPVLRTTALGVALPPIYVHQPLRPYLERVDLNDKEEIDYATRADMNVKENEKLIIPQLTYRSSLYPLAIDSYFPYSSELLLPSLPYYSRPILTNLRQKDVAKQNDQILPVANFKKNPEIPDVPPPPLPVKDKNKQK